MTGKNGALTNQLWIETCETPTGWVVGPPPGTAGGFYCGYSCLFSWYAKSSRAISKKSVFFRARTVVCAHASFRVAFCFSCNCRWTRYDLQQTVPYLGLKKSGQNIQSVAYTLIYNHIEKITDSSLLIYIPLRRWADLVTVSTVSDSWSWIQPKFVQLWHVTCVNITHMLMIIHVSSDHLWHFGHYLFGGFKFCGFSGGWSTKETHAPDVVAKIEELCRAGVIHGLGWIVGLRVGRWNVGIPSGYVKIAIENGDLSWIFPLKMVIFHS